jgi:hypothetical protein
MRDEIKKQFQSRKMLRKNINNNPNNEDQTWYKNKKSMMKFFKKINSTKDSRLNALQSKEWKSNLFQ